MWSIVLYFTRGDPATSKKFLVTSEEEEGEDEEAEEEEVEGTPVEEALEELLGCAGTCMGSCFTPVMILLLIIFYRETKIAGDYGILTHELTIYLLFALVFTPFQVMMDIIMNHITEVVHGVRIYDSLAYAMFRWRNRLTQWLLDDPRMDESIAEPLQSINHLCFSPQFYFVCAYYTWGIFHVMAGMVTLIKNEFNPFDDPLFLLIVAFQLSVNRVLDKTVKFLCFDVLWQPKSNHIYKAFRATVAISLRRKDARHAQLQYREWFLQRHAGWLSGKLDEVFTPRSLDRYRTKLSELYQRTLLLQPPATYKTPGPPFPPPVGWDELPSNLQDELAGSSSSDSDVERAAEGVVVPASLGTTGRAALAAKERETAVVTANLPLVPKAPPAVPVPWPLANPTGDDLKALPPGWIGPLARLAGKAWLETAKRRMKVRKMADQYAEELPPRSKCQKCGASPDSPFVKAGVGIWTDGPKLQITLVQDMDVIIEEFEKHRNVPPMELDQEQWYQWLDRAEQPPWETHCIRCRTQGTEGETPGQLPPVPGQPSMGSFAPLPPITDDSDGSVTPGAPITDGAASGAAAEQPQFSDDEPVPALPNVQVDIASREIILYWAATARRRIKHMNQEIENIRHEGRLLAEDTPSDEESESESGESDEEIDPS